jgi:hypothetical protein
LSVGGHLRLGAFELTLTGVGTVDGPNYLAERGRLAVTRAGKPICAPSPERRFYPAGKQSTSEVALCNLGVSQVYTVLGERRAGPNGEPAWLVRGYYNPWVQLIYLGPLLMALGGLLSLSDRRRLRPVRAAGGPGAGGARPGAVHPDPLPGLPERVDRRFRGRTGRGPAQGGAGTDRCGAVGRAGEDLPDRPVW